MFAALALIIGAGQRRRGGAVRAPEPHAATSRAGRRSPHPRPHANQYHRAYRNARSFQHRHPITAPCSYRYPCRYGDCRRYPAANDHAHSVKVGFLGRNLARRPLFQHALLSLPADEPVQAWLTNPLPSLNLRCQGGCFEVYLRRHAQVEYPVTLAL